MERKPTLHLVTVGTSFFKELGPTADALRNQFDRADRDPLDVLAARAMCEEFVSEPQGDAFPLPDAFDRNPGRDDRAPRHTAYLELLKLDPNEELNRRQRPGFQPDRLPAELSSLLLYYRDSATTTPVDGPKDAVYLLASDSNAGLFSACCIKRFIQDDAQGRGADARCYLRERLGSVTIDYVPGLQGRDAERFQKVGLPSLVRKIHDVVDAQGPNFDIRLNVTGGLKGTIPYATMLAMALLDQELLYLFEDSDRVMRIPLLPVDFDVLSRNEYRAVVKAIPHIQSASQAEGLLRSLPPKLRTIFTEQNGQYVPNAVAELVERSLKERKGAFSRYGQGTVALSLFPEGEEGGWWRDRFAEKLPTIQWIWLGDNIPQTVEHARGHAQRLQELAVQLLRPALDANPDLLSPAELYVLLYTLWIHDLGHSGRRTDFEGQDVDVTGLPSVIRELHHDLGCEMMREDPGLIGFEPAENGGLKDAGVFAEREIDPWRIIEAIATAYRYHRSKMPLDSDSREGVFLWRRESAPVPERFELRPGVTIRLRLITALQRVLDACDNQRERVVDTEFHARRESLTGREVKTERLRKGRLYTAIGTYLDSKGTTNQSGEDTAGEISAVSTDDLVGVRSLHHWLRALLDLRDEPNASGAFQRAEASRAALGAAVTLGAAAGAKSADLHTEFSKWAASPGEDRRGLIAGFTDLELYLMEAIQKLWRATREPSSDLVYLHLATEWVAAADRIVFGILQPAHFGKHAAVHAVLVLPEETGKYSIAVELEQEATLGDREIGAAIDAIVKDIEEEVGKCRGVLGEAGITIAVPVVYPFAEIGSTRGEVHMSPGAA